MYFFLNLHVNTGQSQLETWEIFWTQESRSIWNWVNEETWVNEINSLVTQLRRLFLIFALLVNQKFFTQTLLLFSSNIILYFWITLYNHWYQRIHLHEQITFLFLFLRDLSQNKSNIGVVFSTRNRFNLVKQIDTEQRSAICVLENNYIYHE